MSNAQFSDSIDAYAFLLFGITIYYFVQHINEELRESTRDSSIEYVQKLLQIAPFASE